MTMDIAVAGFLVFGFLFFPFLLICQKRELERKFDEYREEVDKLLIMERLAKGMLEHRNHKLKERIARMEEKDPATTERLIQEIKDAIQKNVNVDDNLAEDLCIDIDEIFLSDHWRKR